MCYYNDLLRLNLQILAEIEVQPISLKVPHFLSTVHKPPEFQHFGGIFLSLVFRLNFEVLPSEDHTAKISKEFSAVYSNSD